MRDFWWAEKPNYTPFQTHVMGKEVEILGKGPSRGFAAKSQPSKSSGESRAERASCSGLHHSTRAWGPLDILTV